MSRPAGTSIYSIGETSFDRIPTVFTNTRRVCICRDSTAASQKTHLRQISGGMWGYTTSITGLCVESILVCLVGEIAEIVFVNSMRWWYWTSSRLPATNYRARSNGYLPNMSVYFASDVAHVVRILNGFGVVEQERVAYVARSLHLLSPKISPEARVFRCRKNEGARRRTGLLTPRKVLGRAGKSWIHRLWSWNPTGTPKRQGQEQRQTLVSFYPQGLIGWLCATHFVRYTLFLFSGVRGVLRCLCCGAVVPPDCCRRRHREECINKTPPRRSNLNGQRPPQSSTPNN